MKVDLLALNSLKNIRLLESILKEGVLVFEGDKEQRETFELSAKHRIFDYKAYRKMIDAD